MEKPLQKRFVVEYLAIQKGEIQKRFRPPQCRERNDNHLPPLRPPTDNSRDVIGRGTNGLCFQ